MILNFLNSYVFDFFAYISSVLYVWDLKPEPIKQFKGFSGRPWTGHEGKVEYEVGYVTTAWILTLACSLQISDQIANNIRDNGNSLFHRF